MKCHQCPVRPGLVCLGETTPSLCLRVAEGQPGRAEQLVALAEVEATPPDHSPSLLTMAGNFAGAVVAHALDGGRQASEAVQAERKAMCFACDLHDHVRDSCSSCGCSAMNLKRSWASSRCPASHWSAV
jgi:hypothetical protein